MLIEQPPNSTDTVEGKSTACVVGVPKTRAFRPAFSLDLLKLFIKFTFVEERIKWLKKANVK